LFYRLNAYEIKVPALRDRADEIEAFAQLFCQEFAAANNQPQKSLDSQVIALLEVYPWPGNLRELRNCIQHGIIDSDDSVIRLENLPECIRFFEQPETHEKQQVRDEIDWELLDDASMDKATFHETAKLIQALEQNHDNRSEAARQLGVSRTTLYNMLKRLSMI
jgi:DNA-binding NtrC family response regulator